MRSLLFWDVMQCRQLPLFWDYLSVPSSRVKWSSDTLEDGTDRCPETDNLFCVTSQTSKDLKNFLEFTDLNVHRLLYPELFCIEYTPLYTVTVYYCILLLDPHNFCASPSMCAVGMTKLT